MEDQKQSPDNYVYYDVFYEALTCYEAKQNYVLLVLFPLLFAIYLSFYYVMKKMNKAYDLSTGDLDSVQSILIIIPAFKIT